MGNCKMNEMEKQQELQATVVSDFVYETILIKPISEIINNLEKRIYRDCDIKWLNSKLHGFTSFAAETLNKKFPEVDLVSDDGNLNQYKRDMFLRSFRTLLSYFKSF